MGRSAVDEAGQADPLLTLGSTAGHGRAEAVRRRTPATSWAWVELSRSLPPVSENESYCVRRSPAVVALTSRLRRRERIDEQEP